MISKFREILPGKIFRGSAPNSKDVIQLKDKFGINKIVSLDQVSGNKIDRICKLLKIKHIIIPLNGTRKTLLELLHHNLKDLLLKGGPTYIHCFYGKDRTGLLAALFKCKYLGMNPDDAIKEAKSLGFGVGVDPSIINLYEKLIKNCKPIKDENHADIVSNERDYKSDNRDSFLDEGHQGSFAPYLSETRQYPFDFVYNDINSQSPTRENYKDEPIKQHSIEENVVPIVGLYNNDAGMQGAGPTENYSGFFYD